MRIRFKSGSAEPAAVCAARSQRATSPVASIIPIAMLTMLSGCAASTGSATVGDTFDSKWGVSSSQRVQVSGPIPKGGGHYKLGSPYQIGGRWYVPRHEPYYDRQGVGSWYGAEFHGRKTANGELYDMDALTAAHPTLPLPSYAYVTNMRNGRTILVRINDRGPYVANREIDLSRASARALGYAEGGLGQVRVRWAGHAPLNGDDRREQAFLRDQPWNGGRQQRPAVARFDRPADPLPEPSNLPPQARYAQDMNRRSDADNDPSSYDRNDPRRDDPAEQRQAAYGAPRQVRAVDDYAASTPAPYSNRPARAYEPIASELDVPVEPHRAATAEQMWSPFGYRQQVTSSSRR